MARVLIVDDDTELREMLSTVILRMGHQVSQASNGTQAIEALRLGGIDLLLTDLLMPEADGFEVIRHARKRMPSIKIIAISGGGRIDPGKYLDVAEQLGALHTLIKPFSKSELESAVSGLVGAVER